MPADRPVLRPKKHLGQHFLNDPNILRKIVSVLDAPADGNVVEIGPGSGALTQYLIERYENLLVIEIDDRAVEVLKGRFEGLQVRRQDVLETDWTELSQTGPLWVIGNLPYNLTSQILFSLLETEGVRQAVFTIQREVAERLVAEPKTKAYGILSVVVQLVTQPSICFDVSPKVFVPRPDVWSSTVRLDWRSSTPEVDFDLLRTVIRTAFNQRRKMLRNSLKGLLTQTNQPLPDDLGSRRPESLLPHEFVDLTRLVFGL